MDRAQRRALDTQLQSIAGAVRVIGDMRDSHLVVDAKDRAQFLTIVGAKAQSAILAPDRSVIVATDDRAARILAAVPPKAAAPSYSSVDVGDERVRLFETPIRHGDDVVGETLAWGDGDAIEALDRSVGLAFLIAIPLLAALAVLAGGEIARRGLMPLDRIATLASEIEGHDLSKRLGLPTRPDELGKLAATFDRMLDRLQSAFDRERRFTSDASHEVRAPLSVIRAEADLALRHERSPAEYRRALETIALESDALEALTRDLLAAARNGSDTEDVRAPVDLSLVAAAAARRLTVIAGTRTMRVRDESATAAIVEGNRALVERALVSVVHNALKYSAETGSVEIRLYIRGSRVELIVADDGPGFSNSALQHGFDRFWRDDEARSRDGSGLGLSLAKTIVERYGGTIALANAVPHGAIVSMTFPRASA